MRCHICDAPLNNITWNRDHQDFDPCGTCLAVIREVFPADEDEEIAETPESFAESGTAETVEPTAEELMQDAEDAAYGRFGE